MKRDIIIIGAGPAGLTAALYAARAGLSVAVFEQVFSGGQAARALLIENYPGFPQGVDGPDLAMRMEEQARRAGAELVFENVTEIRLLGETKAVVTNSAEYEAKTIILCMGAQPRPLGAAGEARLIGRGVSYCASCDGMLFRGKPVAVVGGGNTAVGDALYLAGVCSQVHIIHRRAQLRADEALSRAMLANDKITPHWNATVDEIEGEDHLSAINISAANGETRRIEAAALFVAVGVLPSTELVKGQLLLADDGYIPAGENCQTEIPGVFAAGDIRRKQLRQVSTAVADGANAAESARRYLQGGA